MDGTISTKYGDAVEVVRRRDGSLAVSLAFLRAVNTAEAGTFRVVVIPDFERVAVEERDNLR